MSRINHPRVHILTRISRTLKQSLRVLDTSDNFTVSILPFGNLTIPWTAIDGAYAVVVLTDTREGGSPENRSWAHDRGPRTQALPRESGVGDGVRHTGVAASPREWHARSCRSSGGEGTGNRVLGTRKGAAGVRPAGRSFDDSAGRRPRRGLSLQSHPRHPVPRSLACVIPAKVEIRGLAAPGKPEALRTPACAGVTDFDRGVSDTSRGDHTRAEGAAPHTPFPAP